MGSAKRVIYINIRHRGQLLGEVRLVLGLLSVEADVLDNHHIAVIESGSLGLGVGADNVLGHDDLFAQQLAQLGSHGSQGELLHIALGSLQSLGSGLGLLSLGHGVNLLLFLLVQLHGVVKDIVGPAHMRAEDDLCAVVSKILHGGQGAHNALGVSDGAVLHGDIKVTADQDALTGYVNVFNGLLVEIVHFQCTPSS